MTLRIPRPAIAAATLVATLLAILIAQAGTPIVPQVQAQEPRSGPTLNSHDYDDLEFQVGTPVSHTLLPAREVTTPVTYTLTGIEPSPEIQTPGDIAVPLPPGLQFDPATRTISGTPTEHGIHTFRITVFRNTTNNGSQDFEVFILTEDPPTIEIEQFPQELEKGQSYTFVVKATNLNPRGGYSVLAHTHSTTVRNAAMDAQCTRTFQFNTLINGYFHRTFTAQTSFDIYGCEIGPVLSLTFSLHTNRQLDSIAIPPFTVVGAPEKPTLTTIATGDGTITLGINLGPSVNSFEVKQYQGRTPTTLPFNNFTLSRTRLSTGATGPTVANATISGLLNGVAYRYQVVSENDQGRPPATTTSSICRCSHPATST